MPRMQGTAQRRRRERERERVDLSLVFSAKNIRTVRYSRTLHRFFPLFVSTRMNLYTIHNFAFGLASESAMRYEKEIHKAPHTRTKMAQFARKSVNPRRAIRERKETRPSESIKQGHHLFGD